MSKFLFIESQDPFESPDATQGMALAQSLARDGNSVTVFLVQNAVLGARDGAKAEGLSELARSGAVRVLADDCSLRERGVSDLKAGIAQSNMDELVDLLLIPGQKAVWH